MGHFLSFASFVYYLRACGARSGKKEIKRERNEKKKKKSGGMTEEEKVDSFRGKKDNFRGYGQFLPSLPGLACNPKSIAKEGIEAPF